MDAAAGTMERKSLMTNFEYIIENITERDLADLFDCCYRFGHCKTKFNKSVETAFENWRCDNDKPNKNFFNSSENERPSVYQWERVCKDGVWGSYGYRTFAVAFQHWLGFQHDEKYWKGGAE